jgi:hypothetical protein
VSWDRHGATTSRTPTNVGFQSLRDLPVAMDEGGLHLALSISRG